MRKNAETTPSVNESAHAVVWVWLEDLPISKAQRWVVSVETSRPGCFGHSEVIQTFNADSREAAVAFGRELARVTGLRVRGDKR